MTWLDRIDETEARRLVRALNKSAARTGDAAQDHLQDFARHAKAIAEPALQQAVEFAREEGGMVAQAAAKQAARLGRAAKADPVPIVVGLVGAALLASLVFGRRR